MFHGQPSSFEISINRNVSDYKNRTLVTALRTSPSQIFSCFLWLKPAHKSGTNKYSICHFNLVWKWTDSGGESLVHLSTFNLAQKSLPSALWHCSKRNFQHLTQFLCVYSTTILKEFCDMVLDWSQHDEVKFVYTAILVVFA